MARFFHKSASLFAIWEYAHRFRKIWTESLTKKRPRQTFLHLGWLRGPPHGIVWLSRKAYLAKACNASIWAWATFWLETSRCPLRRFWLLAEFRRMAKTEYFCFSRDPAALLSEACSPRKNEPLFFKMFPSTCAFVAFLAKGFFPSAFQSRFWMNA